MYPCHGGIDQVWRWQGAMLVGHGRMCLDMSAAVLGAEMRTAPCRVGMKSQEWDYEEGGIWLPTGRLRNRLHPEYCITAPLFPYVENDTVSVRLTKCSQGCAELWIANALKKDHEFAIDSYPRLKAIPEMQDNSKSGRVLCWVMTTPKNHATKAVTLRDTWGKYCDILLFATTKHDPKIINGTVVLDLQGTKESRQLLWEKSKLMWMHVYHKYLGKAEWFFRADDDTYVLMDNMRDYLSSLADPTTTTHFLGRRFYSPDSDAYFYGGGSGTMLSQEALRRLGTAVAHDTNDTIFSPYDTFADDLEIALTMARLGINTTDTRDKQGRNRFLGVGLDNERMTNKKTNPDFWLWKYSADAREGRECCSTRFVSSHYALPDHMRYLDDAHDAKCEGHGTEAY
eukprot:m.1272 g.1272  ORF g.1272 m.1272 type:complete len:398 (+) comp860_c0_seq1:2-1195(+)